MQLNKKTIISNTVLFAFIIGFIMAFGALFGDANILIGVSTVTAMLMLLERDLTSHPFANTMTFVLLNLFIGVAAFLTGFNVWLAVPINFLVMFVISYSLLFNLKNPLYLPFSLQYLFLLSVPVGIDQLPLRLASLLVGALAIMGLQLVVNKNKITKSGDKKIQAICSGLIEKTKLLQEGAPHDALDAQIATDISGLRSIIYDKREENYYLTEEGRLKLNVSASLEKINLFLDEVSKEEEHLPIFRDVIDCLTAVSESLEKNGSIKGLEEASKNLLSKYKDELADSLLVLRMLHTIDYLLANLVELKGLGKKDGNVIKKLERIPNKFRKLRMSEKPSHTNSIKLSYAVRMAVAISVSGWIVDFFDIHEGRWMMFTVLSVIIPLYEQSTKKMRDRLFATAVGAILVAGLFFIFEGSTARTILLMTAGYLMSYVKVYRYSTILVTFSAIGAAALLTDATEILTLSRIALVAGGVVLALLINKFILPYKLEDANRDLKAMHADTIREMLVETRGKAEGKDRDHAMKNLVPFPT